MKYFTEPRLLRDVRFILDLVGDRYEAAMDEFYPKVNGKRPWGYIWAVTLPCTNCGNRFPLTGNLKLRNPKKRHGVYDPGQSYQIIVDQDSGTFRTEVNGGLPTTEPTLVKIKGRRGKTGVCCFCHQSRPLEQLKRLMRDGMADEALLVVADHDSATLRRYRVPTDADQIGLKDAKTAILHEPPFGPGLPSVPTEALHSNLSASIGPAGYGYASWGKLCNARQTLGLLRLARIIDTLYREMVVGKLSNDYAVALTGYAASNLGRRLKFSTRSATLLIPEQALYCISMSMIQALIIALTTSRPGVTRDQERGGLCLFTPSETWANSSPEHKVNRR